MIRLTAAHQAATSGQIAPKVPCHDELAFYDAVCQNDSAVLELGDDTLKAIAHELVAVVRRNATIDWDKKEQVRASLRRHIRRLLAKYKYPPDKQESAVSLVMQQAELFAAALVA